MGFRLKQPIFRGEGSSISVNFHEDLVILIRESKYLDRMGFAVPETALNVTLQEDKYHSYVESLNAMLQARHLLTLPPLPMHPLPSRLANRHFALFPPMPPPALPSPSPP